MSEDILTIRDVAEYLKVTEKTVYGLAQKGKIPGFKVGGQWRFKREDIDQWLEDGKEAATTKKGGSE
jgi:excisionase family DNA binding protein